MLGHSHGETVKTVSGNECASVPFQLLCTDLVSKQLSDLSCFLLYIWKEVAVVEHVLACDILHWS